MRGINHPSVVRLQSFFESSEHYFLVLERKSLYLSIFNVFCWAQSCCIVMEGGELFHQIVKLTYFSENLARHVVLQVAQGIRYLHEERGVVHRDIKPENLLFERIPIVPSKQPVRHQYDEDKVDEGEFIHGIGGGGIGCVKIADFGLSKILWDEKTKTPCGTVGYTAPEIVKEERYSKSVDMWALGCVLYTLLCGFPPFYDESINILTEKVARGYYTFLSPWWDDVSAPGTFCSLSRVPGCPTVVAKDLVAHLLCVDPDKRYTIDEFLAHPWCNGTTAPLRPVPVVHNHNDIFTNRPMDSPLLSAAFGGRPEGRSPGLATLKEAFDITYAVHRMEEEGARRRKYRGNRFLEGLNEDDEDDEGAGSSHISEAARQVGAPANHNTPQDSSTRHLKADRKRHSPRGFELDMNGATLLGRRHRRNDGVNARSALPSLQGNGSPLKLETLRISD